MTLRPIALAAPLALLVLSSAVLAQTPPAPGGQAPTDAPAGAPGMAPGGGPGGQGGGMLPRTREDVPAWSQRLFQRLDADQDGAIVSSELLVLTQGGRGAMGGSRLRAMISQSDASRDARVTPDEMDAGAERMFARMDANGDGRLADDELPQPPAPPRPMSIPMPTQPSPMPMPMPTPDGG